MRSNSVPVLLQLFGLLPTVCLKSVLTGEGQIVISVTFCSFLCATVRSEERRVGKEC